MTPDNLAKSFAPIARMDAQILVLGSMPGVASLQVQQYYAHPRNAFWWLIGQFFDAEDYSILPYPQRCERLIEHHVAVWDVLAQCQRRGSLDARIQRASSICNDFDTFFDQHPFIQRIIFNGITAADLFRKQVVPAAGQTTGQKSRFLQSAAHFTVPSTSPAMASFTREQKLEKWRPALMLQPTVDLATGTGTELATADEVKP